MTAKREVLLPNCKEKSHGTDDKYQLVGLRTGQWQRDDSDLSSVCTTTKQVQQHRTALKSNSGSVRGNTIYSCSRKALGKKE